MNEETPEPVRSFCGTMFAWIGAAVLIAGAIVGMIIGGNYRYGATVGWSIFGYGFAAAMGMFAISTALHFLARIATAAEQSAEVLKEQRQEALRQAIQIAH